MAGAVPSPGDVIGDYEILEKLSGNMGLVYKARHRLLDKEVALKLFPPEWTADAARLARFQREMRALGQLKHDNLVTAADARIVDSSYLVTMEWIDGVDLNQLVRNQGPLPIDIACEMARQAARGLEYAHQHKLIHRDIKPSNLMLDRSGTIKVIDLGLALIRDDASVQLTQSGVVMGTMSYCAPEQFRDASAVDVRADIYGLGCTLYHLLVGKPPFWPRKTPADVMQAHLHEPFPCLTTARPEAPEGLEALILRMTAKDPTARFASPSQVAEALEPFARGADLKRVVPPKAASVVSSPPSGHKTPGSAQQRPTESNGSPSRNKWTRRAAFLALIPGAAGAVLLFANPRKPGSKTQQPEQNPSTPEAEPVVVLMDTSKDKGVYDPENQGKTTNAEVLETVLSKLPVRLRIHQVPISEYSWKREWRGEARVLEYRPSLVLIHRSAIFHEVAYAIGYRDYPKPGDPKYEEWRTLYEVCDDKLITFMANLAARRPGLKFLIYSRGTEPKWTDEAFRKDWTKEIEGRFPELQGCITPMFIQTNRPTFKNPTTANEIRQLVAKILHFEQKPEPVKHP